MNKGVWIAVVIVVVLLLILILGGRRASAPENGTATSTSQTEEVDGLTGSGTYHVNTSASNLEWEGTKTLIVDYRDTGTIDLKSGTFSVSNGQLVDGQFVIDMTTLEADSTSNTRAPIANLTNHLKSDDFFAVETFPEAVFDITSVTEMDSENTYNVTGDLTIKGKTNSITFPALIYMKDGDVFVEGEAKVDRTLYDVRFGSANFFTNLGDNVISDMFTLDIRLVAEPLGNTTATSTE